MTAPRKNNLPWFVYIRVSSKDQGDKYGPARQIETIRAWLAANEPAVRVPGLDACVINPREVRASEYIGFDKQTGKNDDRPDFQRGFQMAKDRRIGGFIALRLDRVARNAGDAYALRARLKRMGVRLEFGTQRFDDSATGDLMYSVYAGFAELEGRLILERTAEGLLGRVCGDKLFHSPNSVPYGYTYVDDEVARKHPEAVRGRAIINPEEAAVVRRIFRLYVEERMRARTIMALLNREGVKTRRGCGWWRESVMHVLKKADMYAGGAFKLRMGIEAAKRAHLASVEEQGENALPLDLSGVTEARLELPPIIDAQTARRADAIRKLNQQKAGRPTKENPLSKMVYCSEDGGEGRCGGLFYFRRKGTRLRIGYCSRSAFLHVGDASRHQCRASEIAAHRLEETVKEALKDHLRRPEVAYSAAMRAYRKEHGADAHRMRENGEARLKGLREQQAHFGNLLLNAAMKKLHARAERQFSELEIEIQDLSRELRLAPVSVIYSESSIVEAFARRLAALEAIETYEEMRAFFEATLERVDFSARRNEVVITGSIPLLSAAAGDGGENGNGRQAADSNFTQSLPFVIRRKLRAA